MLGARRAGWPLGHTRRRSRRHHHPARVRGQSGNASWLCVFVGVHFVYPNLPSTIFVGAIIRFFQIAITPV
jgi:hypothetical protein